MTVEYIKESAKLIDFCQRIANSSWLAVDTEFLREKNILSKTLLNSSGK
jgi:ribonuclease D